MSIELLGQLAMNAGFEKTNKGKCRYCTHRTEPALNGLLMVGGGFSKVTCDGCKGYNLFKLDPEFSAKEVEKIEKDRLKKALIENITEAKQSFSEEELIDIIHGKHSKSNKRITTEKESLTKFEKMLNK